MPALHSESCSAVDKIAEVAEECANLYRGNDVLGIDDMQRLVNYVQTTYPGKTFGEFARDMGLTNDDYFYHIHILYDSTPSIKIERNRKGYVVNDMSDLYLKTIDISEKPSVKEKLVYYAQLNKNGVSVDLYDDTAIGFLTLRIQ